MHILCFKNNMPVKMLSSVSNRKANSNYALSLKGDVLWHQDEPLTAFISVSANVWGLTVFQSLTRALQHRVHPSIVSPTGFLDQIEGKGPGLFFWNFSQENGAALSPRVPANLFAKLGRVSLPGQEWDSVDEFGPEPLVLPRFRRAQGPGSTWTVWGRGGPSATGSERHVVPQCPVQ